MKKLYPVIPVLFIGITLFFSCGGGGVSEQFTKELSEFETAWTNTAATFNAVVDSVKTTQAQLAAFSNTMKVPDTLAEKLTGDDSKKLDSLKTNCSGHASSCDAVLKKLEEFKTGWDKESAAFAEWKDRVLKGSIDIETAKKDMKIYKGKLEEAAAQSDKSYNSLTEIKNACSANCASYNSALVEISQRKEEEKRGR